MQQIDIFDCMYDEYKSRKPIRFIEFFAGYGSTLFGLKYINPGVPCEHWKIAEWSMWSFRAYNDLHVRNYKDYSKGKPIEELLQFLLDKGVSIDWNQPANEKQFIRLGLGEIQRTYNDIIATNNLVDISRVKGQDLEIVDIDKYDYWLSYSFPCQDLSLSGLRKGMEEASGTRSSLLWEVGRILKELDYEHRPQVLIMENVPQIHSPDNLQAFNRWIRQLEDLGYQSYWQDMNARDYGVPQNRNRTIMISIKGDYKFNFPKAFKLEKFLKDYVEDQVDDKYYLTDKQLYAIGNWKAQQKPLSQIKGQYSVAPTITARGAGEDHSGMVLYSELFYKDVDIDRYFNPNQDKE